MWKTINIYLFHIFIVHYNFCHSLTHHNNKLNSTCFFFLENLVFSCLFVCFSILLRLKFENLDKWYPTSRYHAHNKMINEIWNSRDNCNKFIHLISFVTILKYIKKKNVSTHFFSFNSFNESKKKFLCKFCAPWKKNSSCLFV